MNRGAKLGGFAQVTGEGGVSRHHLEAGGDLVYQVGTGYFGCRADDGRFDPDRFAETAARESVRMIELKISQGAKPGHGGILPGRKVTAEIAEARGVPVGTDCISPAFHTAFSTPVGLCEFVGRLRELAGGKPVGFKLCIGRPEELFAVCKAMIETAILPDFITIDGSEGGTGAAPIEFCDRMGVPVKEGVVLAHNALVGINLRDKVRIAAAGKLVTGFQIAQTLALGADWCNSARGFMFAVGCIQAQACHTNECPVGVATQDRGLQRALVVSDKAQRVANFHRNTVEALAEVIAAAGLDDPAQLVPEMLFQRTSPTEIRSFDELYGFIEPGQLLEGHAGERLQPYWDRAKAASFR
jgi:glutamate synthase domain-containing protein 2